MKVYLQTLGCKLNESELESWARDFVARGNEIVNDAREADVCVVNTCTVTSQAARKSRGVARHLHKLNNDAQIVLTGCYATLSPDEARLLPNVALVVPNRDKDRLVALAGARFNDIAYQFAQSGCRMPEAASGEIASETSEILRFTQNDSPAHLRTRAFLKIEDGCNMSCTYCIIPLARGRARSRPQNEIVSEVAQLVASGYQEVILTGVQISDYCLEKREALEERERGRGRLRGLCDLVRAILDETDLPRLRLTSIAPWDLEEELLDLFTAARLCRHLHLSLQSGSNTVLRRMRRPYATEQYAEAVALAREKIPDVAITTDVIVGFPGESDAEFSESLEFVERMGFARVHVFPYSTREGTVAARLPLHVADLVKDARGKAMQRVADASARQFAQQFLGRRFGVLFEEMTSPGIWSGYTDNYIRVVAASDADLSNKIIPTRLDEIVEEGARGVVEF